jgi:hypothetical protein
LFPGLIREVTRLRTLVVDARRIPLPWTSDTSGEPLSANQMILQQKVGFVL